MSCLSCNEDLTNIYQSDSFLKLPIYFCKNCKMYITGKTDKERENKIKSLYEKSYWDERSSRNSIESDYTDVDSQGKKRQWISQYKYCKPHMSKIKKILEIGSGLGQVLFWFKNLGFEIHGIEPDKRNVQEINKKLNSNVCKIGVVENFEIDGKYDMIWSSHVFEHVVKPRFVLNRLRNCLLKNGILFLEVPNCENSKILFESINNNPSTFHFSKVSLVNIAKNEGYEIISCDYFRSPKIFEGVINRIFQKYLSFLKYNPYPYYPKILSNSIKGTDIRIILKK